MSVEHASLARDERCAIHVDDTAKESGRIIYHAGLQGNRILFAIAETVIGWLLVRHAHVAQQKLSDAKGRDVAFYQGKIASARWYCEKVAALTC